ncbi:SPOC domain-containing protein [Calycina marina]|uniref:Transcription factor BYE1 n=1 Tax=Calycina marina TaxID=1763456 RepID=A0A9P7Z7S5_9HELO|nr:SPOC domain-containing protein [Calycina marina]
MGDEPRRSVRETKGRHSKMEEEEAPIEQPKKKGGKKGGKKAAAKEEEEEEENVRCVCGAKSDAEQNEDGAWIACDVCDVWQHNTCMDISPFDDEVPKNYKCEKHDPVFHKELLDAMARGIPLWEDRKAKWLKYYKKGQAGPDKKKGKGKTGKRASEVNGISNPPSKVSTPVPEAKKATPAKTSGAKRKDRHDAHENDVPKEPPAKARKVTAPAVQSVQQKTPSSDAPTKIKDLDQHRQGGAILIKKALDVSITNVVKQGLGKLAADDTAEDKAERLAVYIEEGITKTHPDQATVNKQSRSIASNLKQNQELTIKLLSRTLFPSQLAVMTTDDMATSQAKQETAKMKAALDKQSILLPDDGPRIRRTHKGEEVVERDDNIGAMDVDMSVERRRHMLDPNADMAIRSRENSPGDGGAVMSGGIDDIQSQNFRHSSTSKQPLNIDTQRQPVRKQSSHADFDINKVFSSVQSPTGPPSHARRPSGQVAPNSGPGNDPDIDKLLEDDGNESPPYSPAEYNNTDPEVIWKGSVIMDSIATFQGTAKHVGGADLTRTSSLTWTELMQKDLRIAGRIDHARANEYLCSLRYSIPTDVVITHVTALNDASKGGFRDMFDYFHSKTRFGVLTNKGIGNIRDTYLVPIAVNDPLPDFIINLEGHRVPEIRPDNVMLVVLVIRNEQWQPPVEAISNPASRSASFNDPSESPSLPPNHGARNPSLAPGPAMSPIVGQPPIQTATNNHSITPVVQSSPPAKNNVTNGSGLAQPPAPNPADNATQQRDGEETARRLLGDFANAPTISFLMPQAFQMRPIEWEIIKSILEGDERARTDLAHLSLVLSHRMDEEHSGAQQQPTPTSAQT